MLVSFRTVPGGRVVPGGNAEGIVERWKQDKIRAVGRKRVDKLVEAAKSSTGIGDGHHAAAKVRIKEIS